MGKKKKRTFKNEKEIRNKMLLFSMRKIFRRSMKMLRSACDPQ